MTHTRMTPDDTRATFNQQWYEAQATRYAPLFDDGDNNIVLYHIEQDGVIYETTEKGMMEHWQSGQTKPMKSSP